MKNRTVTATDFQARCRALMSEIETYGGTLTITRDGRPVAILSPAPKKPNKNLRDSWAGKAKIIGDIVSPPAIWDVCK